jgi:hypothetical protein
MAGKTQGSRHNKLTQDVSTRIKDLKHAKENADIAGLSRQLRFVRPSDSHPPKSIHAFLEPIIKQNLQHRSAILAQASELLMRTLPEKIGSSIALGSFSHGTLHIHTTSAPAKAEMDRLLRQGLEQQVQIATKGVVSKVRTTIDRKLLNEAY